MPGGGADRARVGLPESPVHFVVPYVPGGGVDYVGRTVAQKLSQAWNHPVVVDNCPGAGTNIGSELVAKCDRERRSSACRAAVGATR